MISKSSGYLTPTTQKLLDKIKDESSCYRCIFNGGGKYQVTSDNYEQFVVDMIKGVFTCLRWEVSGIPCKHAVAALRDQVGNCELLRQPEDLVHPCYRMETWKQMYTCTVEPINGPEIWPKSECPTSILPPNNHVQVGSIKIKRRRGIDEVVSRGSQSGSKGTKLSRKYIVISYGKCNIPGHNSKSCKAQVGGSQKFKLFVCGFVITVVGVC
ncbi:hypothetical protein L1887_19360 [Cichorium endivia]|nr:hypothetical protein L1887_19360 [Cichorium endivia]